MASPPADAQNATTPPPAKEPTPTPRPHPRYRIGKVLGKGGMGVVRLARDQRLNRDVALKTSLQGDSPDQVLQLAREAWLTAHLRHPGIISVLDAGANGDTFYYTMALVQGRDLSEVLKGCATLEERLSLLRHLLDACEAVAYAHSRGVVHCDLKPHNIMVGAFGETQVMDWGLAVIPDPDQQQAWRALGLPQMDRRAASLPTGTPAYMSPEQARSERLDARTDVWSLGAILFQLLTGVPPHHRGNWAQQHLRAREGRVPSIASLQPDAPPELIAIAQRAMSLPHLRYPDAGALAAELARWFEGRRIVAYQYTASDHLRRMVRGWHTPLRIAGAAILITGAMIAWSQRRTSTSLDEAREAEQSAQHELSLADAHLAQSLVHRAVEAARRGARPQAELLAAHAMKLSPHPDAAGVLAAFGNQDRPTFLDLRDGFDMDCRRRLLSWDGDTLWCLTTDAVSRWSLATHPPTRQWSHRARQPLEVYPHQESGMVGVAQSQRGILWLNALDGTEMGRGTTVAHPFQQQPTSSVLAAGGGQGFVLRPGGSAITFLQEQPGHGHTVESAAVSPDGRTLARINRAGELLLSSTAVFDEGHVTDEAYSAVEPEATVHTELMEHFVDSHAARTVAWLPDSKRLVVGSIRGRVATWSADEGITAMAVLPVGKIEALVPSPDGSVVLVQGTHGDPQLWNPTTGAWRNRIPVEQASQARWTAPNEIAFLTPEGIETWRVPRRPPPATLQHLVGLSHLAMSTDGSMLAISRSDASIDVRNVVTGELIHTVVGENPHQVCKASGFVSSGTHLVSSCLDNGVLLTNLTTGGSERVLASGTFRRVGALANGLFWGQRYATSAATFSSDGDLVELPLQGATADVSSTLDGSAVAFLDDTGLVHLLRAANSQSLERWRTVPGGQRVAISGDATTVAVAQPGEVLLMSGPWEEPRSLAVQGAIASLALSPDGSQLALGFQDGSLQLYDTGSMQLQIRQTLHTAQISSLIFHPKGHELWSASWDGSVRRMATRLTGAPPEELVHKLEEDWDLHLVDVLEAAPI